jgi:hypothetical protein
VLASRLAGPFDLAIADLSDLAQRPLEVLPQIVADRVELNANGKSVGVGKGASSKQAGAGDGGLCTQKSPPVQTRHQKSPSLSHRLCNRLQCRAKHLAMLRGVNRAAS